MTLQNLGKKIKNKSIRRVETLWIKYVFQSFDSGIAADRFYSLE